MKKNHLKNPEVSDVKGFNKLINREEMGINRELFQKLFKFQSPSAILKHLYNTDSKKKNNALVDVIKSGLSVLKDEIKQMPEDEIDIEKPYKIVDIVEKILTFNRKNQERQGLKILTPNQMLSRLPNTLVQLKAGNNPEKLKIKIRQLLYSLYCSKKLVKPIYNGLINTI